MTSGVYIIRNTINGRVYVGCSGSIEHRWNQHKSLLKTGSHPYRDLQEDWDKYGSQSFAFEIIDTDKGFPLKRREEKWIRHFGNLCYKREARHNHSVQEVVDMLRKLEGEFGLSPSTEHIAGRCGMTFPTVIKYLKRAVAQGLIVRTRRGRYMSLEVARAFAAQKE